MPGRDRFRPRGHTLFEWGAIVCVLGTVLAVFLHYVPYYQREAEAVHVKQVVAAMRTSLAARATQLVNESGEIALRDFVETNPVSWLVDPPSNYAGEYYRPQLGIVSPGNWYFDRADKTLVYFPHRYKSFSSEPSKLLRFKVEFSGSPDSAFTEGRRKETTGISLERIE